MNYNKVVLFTGDTETLAYFSRRLAEYFISIDKEIFLFDFGQELESFLKLSWFLPPDAGTDDTVMVTFNFIGFCGESIFIEENGASIWDNRNIPCLNIVVDHPFYYHKFKPLLPKRYIQFSIDRDHEIYLKRFFPEIISGGFLPLAGTSYIPLENKAPQIMSCCGKLFPLDYGTEEIPYEKRSMDIVFTGNYTPTDHLRPYLNDFSKEYADFYFRIIDDFLDHPWMAMDAGIEKHLWEEVEELNEEGLKACMPGTIFIDLYVRFTFRAAAVRTLADAGFRVHVFGGGWEHLSEDYSLRHPENIIPGGPLDSPGCLKKIADSRISLNVMPWFKQGAHDRVFNSMLCGAVSLTDSSIYMKEILRDMEQVVFYELNDWDGLAQKADWLLSHPKKAEEIAEAGRREAVKRHQWRHRGEELDRYISQKIICG